MIESFWRETLRGIFVQLGKKWDTRRRKASVGKRIGSNASWYGLLVRRPIALECMLPKGGITYFVRIRWGNFHGALSDDLQFSMAALDRKILGAVAEIIIASRDECGGGIDH